MSPRVLLLAVLAAGLLLRLALAFVVFPDQGYAGDLRLGRRAGAAAPSAASARP